MCPAPESARLQWRLPPVAQEVRHRCRTDSLPLRPVPAPSLRPWAGTRLGAPDDHVGELWLAGPDQRVAWDGRRADAGCAGGGAGRRPGRAARDRAAGAALSADRQAHRRGRLAVAPGPPGRRARARALRSGRRSARPRRGWWSTRTRAPSSSPGPPTDVDADGAARGGRGGRGGPGPLPPRRGARGRHAADPGGHAPRDRRGDVRVRDRAAVGPHLPDLGLGPADGTDAPHRRVAAGAATRAPGGTRRDRLPARRRRARRPAVPAGAAGPGDAGSSAGPRARPARS